MFRSIRRSLLFWYSLILLFVTGGFGAAIYYQQGHARRMRLDSNLTNLAQLLSVRARPTGVGGPPPPHEGPPDGPPERPPHGPDDGPPDGPPDRPPGGRMRPDRPRPARPDQPPGERATVQGGVGLPESVVRRFEDDRGRYFVIWRRDGAVARTSDGAPETPYPGPVPTPPEKPEALRFRDRGLFREAVMPGPGGMQIVVGQNTEADRAAMRQLVGILLGVGLSVLTIGLFAGWLLANQIVRPIRSIQRAAETISETSLERRIDVATTHEELTGLARVLNSVFARLRAAFERQTRFTADASHELRTPLAVIHAEVEYALTRPRSEAEYRAALETCLRAAKRMRPLVDSLLTLARADAGAMALRLERCDLGAIVRECAELVQPLAAEREVRVDLDLQPAELTGDSFRLTQAVANLMTNAILYNRRQGGVMVDLRSDSREVLLTVSDTGVGIAPEHLPRVFDRFFRVDESRSRESGGAGLGLSICKSVVEAHGGTIGSTSQLGVGTTFTVRLPVDGPATS
jgi:heavy metal sensor kinase